MKGAKRLHAAVAAVIDRQKASGKPLAIVLAGHNGSGKSTMWYEHLADRLKVPLINADRMMLSILPEVKEGQSLPGWAMKLRDKNDAWMGVAQKGVESFVAQAMASGVPFATETVFSYWEERGDGSVASKADMIRRLQGSGYFVLLFFVGLGNVNLSMARVASRKAVGGHDVDRKKLMARFPRTQKAVHYALPVADAAILTDNSLGPKEAFKPVWVQLGEDVIFDVRTAGTVPAVTEEWMRVVCDGRLPAA